MEKRIISNNIGKIIMVHSYKGGTGKTAIALNLMQYLASKLQKKTLLIEQDTGGSSFAKIFGLTPTHTWNDFFTHNLPLKDLIVTKGNFDIICASTDEIEIPTGEHRRAFHARQLERLSIQRKWLLEHYAYIILDTHPGYTLGLLNSIVLADIAILVSRLDVDTISKTIDLYNTVYSQFKNKQILMVQNQVPTPVKGLVKPALDTAYEETLKDWQKFIATKDFLSIPLKNEIAYTLSRNKLVPFDNEFMTYIQKLVELIL